MNEIYLSDPARHVLPREADSDHVWEQYIKDKYEYKRFMSITKKVDTG
jgi:hypothetical protein